MKLLLDTHALLWSIIEPDRLSATAHAALTDPASQVAVSAVSFGEISIEAALGKLRLAGVSPEELAAAAQRQGFGLPPLEARRAASFSRLPADPQYRDPVDRMPVRQAISQGYTLVSRDRTIAARPVEDLRTLWQGLKRRPIGLNWRSLAAGFPVCPIALTTA